LSPTRSEPISFTIADEDLGPCLTTVNECQADGTVSSADPSVTMAAKCSGPRSDAQQVDTPQVDCKTIQTEESFLQRYRSKKKAQAKRPTTSILKVRTSSCSSEAASLPALRSEGSCASSTSSEASHQLSWRPAAACRRAATSPSASETNCGGFRHSTEDRMVKSKRSTIFISADDSLEDKLEPYQRPRTELMVRDSNMEGFCTGQGSEVDGRPFQRPLPYQAAKPVRGQCAASIVYSNHTRTPVGTCRSTGPYKRSLSRSSHCLLTSTLSSPEASLPYVRWDAGDRRNVASMQYGVSYPDRGFYIDVYEGQSTLV
jgi:hypothetical protein